MDDGTATGTAVDAPSNGTNAGTVTGPTAAGQADHVVYAITPEDVWIDVFAEPNAAGNACFFHARVYGG